MENISFFKFLALVNKGKLLNVTDIFLSLDWNNHGSVEPHEIIESLEDEFVLS